MVIRRLIIICMGRTTLFSNFCFPIEFEKRKIRLVKKKYFEAIVIFYFAVLKVKTAVNKILNFAIKIRLDETRHGVLSTETQPFLTWKRLVLSGLIIRFVITTALIFCFCSNRGEKRD